MEIDHPPQRSGYSLKLFIDPKLAEKFICTICKNVLKNAVQIPESLDPKRACQDCYKDNIRYVSYLKRVFSSLYFPDFGLNLKIYRVDFRIQLEYGKIWTRKILELHRA